MDIYQYFGADIVTSVNGDLQTVDGVAKGQQRILRRLMTIAGTYVWHPGYGAGLPQFVGTPAIGSTYLQIKSLIRSQLYLESVVSQSPAPIITVQGIPEGLYVTIQYTDAPTNTLQILSFTVSP